MEFSRRSMIQSLAGGGLLLPGLLSEMLQGAPARDVADPLAPRQPHFPAKVKRVIFLFMTGAVSQVDTFDPKPYLSKHHDQSNGKRRFYKGSDWKFQPYGKSGIEVSDLFPHVGSVIDDICLIRSMHTGYNGHEVSIRYMHSGIPSITGRPTLGSWLLYGLGSETNNLPSYMVMTDPGGHPVDGIHNWSNGWMPTLFQGTVLRPKSPRILNLDAPPHLSGKPQENFLEFLSELNRNQSRPGELDLEARIASFELAARMQTAAADVMDISSESEATKKMYGIDDDVTREYGTRCLIARRLVERGVRFVQLFLNGPPWGPPPMLQVTFLTLPIRPSRIIPMAWRNLWPISERCWVPTWKIRPVSLTTLQICLPSSMVRVSGFSQYTSLPARMA